MKKYLLGLLCCVLVGCSSVAEQSGISLEPTAKKNLRGLTNIDQVRAGMKYGEVVNLMGSEVTIGYQQSETAKDGFEAITLKNPYRVEIFRQGEKSYSIVYYFTHLVKTDGMVSEDELTPLVFDEELLVGKGWDYLFKLKNQ